MTVTEAAERLGIPRALLVRLCSDGRVPTVLVGESVCISTETVVTIERERVRAKAAAREAVASAEERRLARAAAVAMT
jgi:excisionase family DNA binding protein